ncbi:hypothetical protein EVAR_37904_1 [Eumeta japonica]|uniref:Uncharacterized protein n=1 Tax=Eumeta variegata TaxID=151549 RepID=A0A4C1XFY6_EUMVA|nr:hypothetical protein EVAR_37904_1 [Eumeta japonica]
MRAGGGTALTCGLPSISLQLHTKMEKDRGGFTGKLRSHDVVSVFIFPARISAILKLRSTPLSRTFYFVQRLREEGQGGRARLPAPFFDSKLTRMR